MELDRFIFEYDMGENEIKNLSYDFSSQKHKKEEIIGEIDDIFSLLEGIISEEFKNHTRKPIGEIRSFNLKVGYRYQEKREGRIALLEFIGLTKEATMHGNSIEEPLIALHQHGSTNEDFLRLYKRILAIDGLMVRGRAQVEIDKFEKIREYISRGKELPDILKALTS